MMQRSPSAFGSVRDGTCFTRRLLLIAATLAVFLFAATSPVHAVSGTWTVDADGVWNVTSNWQGGTIATGSGFTADFSQLNITGNRTATLDTGRTLTSLIFGDTGGTIFDWTINGGFQLTLAGTTPTIQTSTAGQTVTIGVVIGGSTAWSKTGPGTLVLNQVNTFTGGVTISGGTLRMNNAAALSSNVTPNLRQATITNSGTRLEVNGVTVNNGVALTFNDGTELHGIGTAGSDGRITIASGATVTFSTAASGDVFTVGSGVGDLSGSGTIRIEGPGTIHVGQNNSTTFTGTWLVNAGTLQIGSTSSNSLGDSAITTINSGGTLSLTGTTARNIPNAFTLNGGIFVNGNTSTTASILSGAITLSNSTTNTFNAANTTNALNITGMVTGGGSLLKIGPGTITLSNTANNYSGGTTISVGTVSIVADASLGATSGGLTLAGGTLAVNTNGLSLHAGRSVTLGTGGGTFDVTNANFTLTVGGTITGAGGLTKTGTGTLVLANTNNSYSGGTTVSAGILAISADANLGATSGGLTLAGGTLAVTANSFALHGNRSVSLSTGGGTLSIDSGLTLTVAQNIQGSTNLTKRGEGTLALTAANSLTGAVQIAQGTLSLSGANGSLTNASGITLAGATLRLEAGNSNRIANTTGITVNSTSTLSFGAAGETVGSVTIGSGLLTLDNTTAGSVTLGGLTHSTGGTVNFVGSGGTLGGSTKVLITGMGDGLIGGWSTVEDADFAYYDSTGGTGVKALGNNDGTRLTTFAGATATTNVRISASLDYTTTTSVKSLLIDGPATIRAGTATPSTSGNNLVLTIASGGILATSNATLAATTANPPGAAVVGAKLTSGTSELYINVADGATLSIINSNGANSIRVDGAVTLVKSGLGTLSFVGGASGNSHSGGNVINEGTLSILTETDLGTNMALTFNGGTLENRAGVGTSALVTLNAAGGTFRTLATNSLSGQFTGLGGFTKTGGSTLSLTNAANNFTGDIRIEEGTLILSSAAAGGASTGKLIFAGGSLSLANAILAKPITVLTTGAFVRSSGTLTLQGTISGPGTLIKEVGVTTVRLENLSGIASNWTGGFTINAGTLVVANQDSFSSAAIVTLTTSDTTAILDISALTSQTIAGLQGGASPSTTVSLGAAILTINNTADFNYAGTITGTGGLIKTGAGVQSLSHTGNTFLGVTISGGVLSVSHDGNLGTATGSIVLNGGTLRWAGTTDQNIARTVTLSASSAVDVADSATTVTIGSNLTGSGNSFTKLGAGRLVLTAAANTYDGTTTITAGTLHITNTLTSGGGVVAVGTTGTLQGSGLTSILRNVTVTGNGTLSFSGGSIGGTLTATGGIWTGNGSVGGAITINPGTFTLSSGGTITASGLTTINSSGVLNLNGTLSGSASLAGGTITGSGGTIGGTLAVTGGAWSGSGTVNSVVSQTAGTFNLTNSGTLTTGSTVSISGGTFNVLVGSTLNNAGTATVTGSATLSANGIISGGVIVNNGGTLHGNGTISGSVTINSGGNLSAGNSVGHLTVDDDMTWNSGSNQVFEISDADMLGTPGTDWDLITVNGELTLNATPGSKINLKFDSWPPGVPLENFDALDSYSWLWITTTGGIDVGSYPVNALFNFTLGPEFAGDFPLVDVDNFNVSLSLDGLNMFVNYTIAVVPEPGTMLLASLAAVGLGVYGRRNRRQRHSTSTPSNPSE